MSDHFLADIIAKHCFSIAGVENSQTLMYFELSSATKALVRLTPAVTLPDDYWPAEWRKHVRALGITSLALIYWMADKGKGHEFDLRATQALDEVGEVFLEMEHSMFD